MTSKVRASPQQLDMLLGFMEIHGDLSKPTSRIHDFIEVERLWTTLTNSLNAIEGGVSRSSSNWKKVWQDLKLRTKHKVWMLYHQNTTCDGPAGRASRQTLSTFDQRLLDVIDLSEMEEEGPMEILRSNKPQSAVTSEFYPGENGPILEISNEVLEVQSPTRDPEVVATVPQDKPTVLPTLDSLQDQPPAQPASADSEEQPPTPATLQAVPPSLPMPTRPQNQPPAPHKLDSLQNQSSAHATPAYLEDQPPTRVVSASLEEMPPTLPMPTSLKGQPRAPSKSDSPRDQPAAQPGPAYPKEQPPTPSTSTFLQEQSPAPSTSASLLSVNPRQLSTPVTPQSVASIRRRIRTRRRALTFERVVSNFTAMEYRRLQLEETRVRQQHEREMQVYTSIVNAAHALLEYCRRRDDRTN